MLTLINKPVNNKPVYNRLKSLKATGFLALQEPGTGWALVFLMALARRSRVTPPHTLLHSIRKDKAKKFKTSSPFFFPEFSIILNSRVPR
ncbi:hypothetical protein RAM19_11340 [Bartonella apihabitans]|nr:hypothetical protein [Bartonella apihabitans]WLT08580.1 hypothetical protein RAM19_11340 [Bartonella apihabitans]